MTSSAQHLSAVQQHPPHHARPCTAPLATPARRPRRSRPPRNSPRLFADAFAQAPPVFSTRPSAPRRRAQFAMKNTASVLLRPPSCSPPPPPPPPPSSPSRTRARPRSSLSPRSCYFRASAGAVPASSVHAWRLGPMILCTTAGTVPPNSGSSARASARVRRMATVCSRAVGRRGSEDAAPVARGASRCGVKEQPGLGRGCYPHEWEG